ncbi:MAG: hypothetical protein K2X57_01905 [Xanthobacteraceae bacterium]|nr:hypothetical protein [Xanthobacteraceae bacterium]
MFLFTYANQAASLQNFRGGLLLPPSRINTSATDYRVVTYMQLQRFNGASWDEVK